MEIKNNIAVISGAASGMGAATAKFLAEHGAKIFLLDKNVKAAQDLARDINGIALECDVSSAENVEETFQTILTKASAPRICINCAGIVYSKRMVGKEGPLPLSEFQKVIAINLLGTINMMRMAAANMTSLSPLIDGERGIIINTASIAAYDGQIGQTAYSASKGGIVSLTLPAAREFAQFGIRVVTIAPGLVNTPMANQIPEESRKALANSVPFPKRLAEPIEFARLAGHIIENVMINGEVIRLDGALRMAPK